MLARETGGVVRLGVFPDEISVSGCRASPALFAMITSNCMSRADLLLFVRAC